LLALTAQHHVDGAVRGHLDVAGIAAMHRQSR
jgi:hypothetical protein